MVRLIDFPDLGRAGVDVLSALGIEDPASLLARCPDLDAQTDVAEAGPFNMSILRGWLRRAELLRIDGVDLALATALIESELGTLGALVRAGGAQVKQRLDARLTGAPDAGTCDELVARAAALTPVARLPEDVLGDADASVGQELGAASLLSLDRMWRTLDALGRRLLDRVAFDLDALPSRRPPPLASDAVPFILRDSDDNLAAAIAEAGSLIEELGEPAEALSVRTPAELRQLLQAPLTFTPTSRLSPRTLVRLVAGSEAFVAARSRRPQDVEDLTELASDLAAVEAGVAERHATLAAIVAEPDRARADQRLAAELAAVEPRLERLAELQARVRRATDAATDLRTAGLALALERACRAGTTADAFAAIALAQLRAGLALDGHAERARTLPPASPPLPTAEVEAVRAGGLPAGEVFLVGLRVGSRRTADGVRLVTLRDLAGDDAAIEVSLPGEDRFARLTYKPAAYGVRVAVDGGAQRSVAAVATSAEPADWPAYLAAEVAAHVALDPGADCAQFPRLLDLPFDREG